MATARETANAKETEADLRFLVARQMQAGCVDFGGGRRVGVSSNAIVRAVYGGTAPRVGELASDADDLAACYRTAIDLPAHRKAAAAPHLARAEAAVRRRWGPDAVAAAQRRAAWHGAGAPSEAGARGDAGETGQTGQPRRPAAMTPGHGG